MHEVGSIVEGKVTGITKFGAFVELDDGTTGMVHISEVSQTYVNDISEHLKDGQEVKVKILAVNDDKKISLSIKKALPPMPRNNGDRNYDNKNNNNNNRDRNFNRNNNDRNNGDRPFNRNNNNNGNNNHNNNNDRERSYNNQKTGGNNNRSSSNGSPNSNHNHSQNSGNNRFNKYAATTPKGPAGFEDMLSKFLTTSEDKMSDVKKPSSNRRGGHSAKRSRDYD